MLHTEPDEAAAGSPESGSPESLKVDWLELFFDLSFVALIAQLTGRLHGDPGVTVVASTFALLGVVWFAWFNEVALTNIAHGNDLRWRLLVLASMAGVGIMAVAVSHIESGRASIFAIGYAVARIALTPMWLRANRARGISVRRPLLFGLGVGLSWLGSALVPAPAIWWVWAVLIAIEVAISIGVPANQNLVVDGGHMTERVQLFVMIVFGESVALLIADVSAYLTPQAWVSAGLGFLLLCVLFMQYYDLAMSRFERAIKGARTRLGDVLGLGPAAVIAGLVGIAAGLGAAVEHAGGPIPRGSLLILCGGMIAFSLGITLLSIDAFRLTLRTRDPVSELSRRGPHRSKAWTVLILVFMVVRDVTVPLLVGVLGGHLRAWQVLALLAVMPTVNIALIGASWWLRLRKHDHPQDSDGLTSST